MIFIFINDLSIFLLIFTHSNIYYQAASLITNVYLCDVVLTSPWQINDSIFELPLFDKTFLFTLPLFEVWCVSLLYKTKWGDFVYSDIVTWAKYDRSQPIITLGHYHPSSLNSQYDFVVSLRCDRKKTSKSNHYMIVIFDWSMFIWWLLFVLIIII